MVRRLGVGKVGRSAQRLKSAGVTAVLLVAALYVVGPLYWLAVASGKGLHELFSTSTFVPGPDLEYGANLHSTFTFNGAQFGRWLVNSLVYAGVSASLAVYFAAMAGYLLAWFDFRGRRLLLALTVGALTVPASVLVIPTYILESSVLHVINSYVGVILPTLAYPLGTFFIYVYSRQAIPAALLDAGRVDGVGEVRLFHLIGLRLLVPGLATLFLLSFIGTWNSYFLPLVLLSNAHLYPSTLGLATWVADLGTAGSVGSVPPYQEILMGSVVSVLPMIVLFPFLQRFVRSGLLSGAVVGD